MCALRNRLPTLCPKSPDEFGVGSSASSAQEFRNRGNHRLLLVFAQFGEDGQG